MQNHEIKRIATRVLIFSVTVLTFVAILSIWDVFSEEVLWKSISTIGVVAFGALIVIVATQGFENKNSQNSSNQQ
ncbi:MAG: hypothetical protein WC059_00010 [Candidatus Paceibacterota bacterium]